MKRTEPEGVSSLSSPNVVPKKPKNVEETEVTLKLELAKQYLKPFPFVPPDSSKISNNARIIRGLGLWDFVNMKFDQEIRTDLLASLIATYDSSSHCSIVNGRRINVSRDDLAQALNLPLSRALFWDRISEFAVFVSWLSLNWIFLSNDGSMFGDMIAGPSNDWKVDLAGWLWFMVEKELTQAPLVGTCYYASHLQCLMKSQHGELFKDEPMDKEKNVVDLRMVNLEDGNNGDELQEKYRQIKLSIGPLNKNESGKLDPKEDAMQAHNSTHVGSVRMARLETRYVELYNRLVGKFGHFVPSKSSEDISIFGDVNDIVLKDIFEIVEAVEQVSFSSLSMDMVEGWELSVGNFEAQGFKLDFLRQHLVKLRERLDANSEIELANKSELVKLCQATDALSKETTRIGTELLANNEIDKLQVDQLSGVSEEHDNNMSEFVKLRQATEALLEETIHIGAEHRAKQLKRERFSLSLFE